MTLMKNMLHSPKKFWMSQKPSGEQCSRARKEFSLWSGVVDPFFFTYKFGSTYKRPYELGSTCERIYEHTYKFWSTDKRTCKFGSTYKHCKHPAHSCGQRPHIAYACTYERSYEFWSTYKHSYERTYESRSTYKSTY